MARVEIGMLVPSADVEAVIAAAEQHDLAAVDEGKAGAPGKDEGDWHRVVFSVDDAPDDRPATRQQFAETVGNLLDREEVTWRLAPGR